MIIKRLLEPVFVFFSKIYIHFYEDLKNYWKIFPSLILATLFTINLEVMSFYLIDINKYYYAGLAIFFAIFFLLLYKNIKYEYVKNYKMSNKTKVIISISILIDFVLIFIFANISRNGQFMW